MDTNDDKTKSTKTDSEPVRDRDAAIHRGGQKHETGTEAAPSSLSPSRVKEEEVEEEVVAFAQKINIQSEEKSFAALLPAARHTLSHIGKQKYRHTRRRRRLRRRVEIGSGSREMGDLY